MAKTLRNMMGAGLGAQTAKLINGVVFDSLTATGSTQADALALSGDVNVVSSVPSGAGVLLPLIPQPGDETIVANLGANDLNVYPAVGCTLQGASANSPYSLSAGATAAFIARKGSQNWIVLSGGGSIVPALGIPAPIGAARFLDSGDGTGTAVTAPVVGQYLYIDPGPFTGTPTSYDYQVYSAGVAIAGETGTFTSSGDAYYLVTDDQIGNALSVKSHGINASGTSATTSDSSATTAVADIDLSADAPALARTTGSGVTPVLWDTTFGSKTVSGYQARLQTGASGVGTGLQDIVKILSAADLVPGATIDWSTAIPALTAIGTTDGIRMRVEAESPLGFPYESPWSNVISPTDVVWTPAVISPAFWATPIAGQRYTTTTHTTAANDTDVIGCLVDRSAAPHDAVQATLANKPIAHDLAGKSWATFDGSNDFLSTASAISMTDGSGQWTAWAAVKFNSVSGVQLVVDGDAGSSRVAQFVRMNSGVFDAIAFKADGTPITATGTTALSTGVWYNVAVICTTTSLKIYLGTGSTLTLEATAAVSGALATFSQVLGLGCNNAASPIAFLNGQIADCGVRPASTSTGGGSELASFGTYLAGIHA